MKENNKRLQILAISFLFPNSQQRNLGIFVFNRLQAIRQYADVTVINPIPWFPILRNTVGDNGVNAIPQFEVLDGLPVYHPHYFSVPGVAKWLEAFTYSHVVSRLIAKLKIDFDIIDLHWTYPDLPVGVKFKKHFKRPLICTLRGMEAFYHGDGFLREHYIRTGLIATDQLIALSQELKDTADSVTKAPTKSTVIINGVDMTRFGYIEKSVARRYLGLKMEPHQPLVISVGSLIKRKGFDMVIDALVKLKASMPGIKYYILGAEGPEGDYRAELRAQVKYNKLEDTVVFQGAVANAELKNWYNAADVFCLASRGEGSPNVLSEALACGCPAVATNVGSASDIMANAGFSDYVVSDLSSDAIASKLQVVIQRDWDRQLLSNNNKQYDWDWCARNVLPIYEKVLHSTEP